MGTSTPRGLGITLLAVLSGQAMADGNALHFDGQNDRVEIPLPAVFQSLATQDVSFSAWIRREETSSPRRVFFAQHATNQFATLLLSAGGNPLFYVQLESGVQSATVDAILPAGTWTHVAVTWNAATLSPRIYVDGVQQETRGAGPSSSGSNGVLTLGSRSDGTQVLPGALDNVRLWSATLTPEQVRTDALSACGASAPMIASYDFDVGAAGGDNAGLTALPDVSGAGANGTLVNFALAGATSNWIESSVAPPAPALAFDPPLPSPLATGEDATGYVGSVALAAPAATDVTVAFAVDDASEASVSSASIVFTPENWNVPQPVSILGLDDADFDGQVAYEVSITAQDDEACYSGAGFNLPAFNADDESARIDASGVVQAEGDATPRNAVFELTLDGTVPGGVSIPYATVDGTALAGTDYVASSGTVVFSGATDEVMQVIVPVLGNLDAQENRAFSLLLGPASLPSVSIVPGRVDAVIVDDDLDVSVVLDDGADVAVAGQALLYNLVVSNLSPTLAASAVGVNFSTLPPLEDLRWSCTGLGGAVCTSGSGTALMQTVALPPDAAAVYALSGTVPPGHTGDVVATASAWPDPEADSQPQDNVAVDIDLAPAMFADGFE